MYGSQNIVSVVWLDFYAARKLHLPPYQVWGNGHMRKAQVIPHPLIVGRPCCEICDAQMSLVSIEPDEPDHDRRTFECPRCQHVTVEVVRYKNVRRPS